MGKFADSRILHAFSPSDLD